MTRRITFRHDGTFEGMAVRTFGGDLRLHDGQWALRFWSSGATIGGSVLRADFAVEPLRSGRSRLEIESFDGRYSATVVVAARPDALDRQLARARSEATKANAERMRIRAGDWWLDRRVFAELGPGESTSIVDARYVGGWTGDAPIVGRQKLAILDLDSDGITLRGLRRQLQISWPSVQSLAVSSGEQTSTVVRVLTLTGEVRFESRRERETDVRERLAPLIRRLHHTAASSGHPGIP